MELAGKRVLVTGADGFIGSHLVEHLVAIGCDVRAFVWYTATGSWGWLEATPPAVRERIEVFTGDVRDASAVRAAVAGRDVVFHLAALIGIPYSYEAPDAYVATNVVGTFNVIDVCRATSVARVIITSTSEVYGTAQSIPMTEDHPRVPQSPYAATKVAADALAQSYHRAFGLPVVIARPFNTYGPRQSSRAVIPTICTQLLAGQRVIRLGSLTPTRDLLFVEDTCRALAALATCDAAIGEDVHFGTGVEVSIGDLAALCMELTGVRAEIITERMRIRPQESEVEQLLCDATRMHSLTGWTPRVSLRDGVARAIEWLREPAHLARYRPTVYAR